MEITLLTGIIIFALAFFAELTDSTLGMGYGTALTPILLVLGFSPLEVVPAILVSEFITGILAGLAHQSVGNISFVTVSGSQETSLQFRPIKNLFNWFQQLNRDMKILILFSSCGVLGSLVAVFIAVKIPASFVKIYIALLILSIGFMLIMTQNKQYNFSWKRLGFIGFLASFNKGISGGGYGPLVTGGQILSGISEKNAIAITSFTEGITCFVGLIVYAALKENPFQSSLLPILICAGTLSVPFSALFVKKMNAPKLRRIIGWITLALGIFSLLKILIK